MATDGEIYNGEPIQTLEEVDLGLVKEGDNLQARVIKGQIFTIQLARRR